MNLTELYNEYKGKYPQGISPKLQGKKIHFQFKNPTTGKNQSKKSGEEFSIDGIINAWKKSFLVIENLYQFSNISDFWNWYDEEILGFKKVKENRKTYQEIFNQITEEYYSGLNRNTKRPRSRLNVNDQKTFRVYYGRTFDLFSPFCNLLDFPKLEHFQEIIYRGKKGTKTYKDTIHCLKKIAQYCHNREELLEYLNSLDFTQIVKTTHQSISWEQYLEWFLEVKRKEGDRERSNQYLWFTAMMVCYGLRPSEILGIKNLTEPVVKDNHLIIKPYSENEGNIIYLDDYFLFNEIGEGINISIKTGARFSVPMLSQKNMKLLDVLNPKREGWDYTPKKGSKPNTITNGLNRRIRDFLVRTRCPVTQAYAFRHLSNQLGEFNGISQEIRARSFGHSVAMNDSIYKSRNNSETELKILRSGQDKWERLEISLYRLFKEKNIEIDLDEVMRIIKSSL